MQNKLQELTDKIYQEGIARGKEEAETIVAGARAESDKILKKAEEAAAAIMSKAEKDAEELRKNTLSEIRISFRHSSNALKQYLENLISKKVIGDPVSDTFSDTSFVARLIELTVGKFASDKDDQSMDVYIPEEMAGEIEKYFSKKTASVLSSGLSFHPIKNMKNGFEISPAGKDYKVSVTEDDFAAYLKEFMRPGLLDLLFEKEK